MMEADGSNHNHFLLERIWQFAKNKYWTETRSSFVSSESPSMF